MWHIIYIDTLQPTGAPNMTHRTAITFATIPEWARPATPGKHGFYAAIALAGLEGKTVRLSADDQRAILGSVVFGKLGFVVDAATGEVTVARSVCFGTMADTATYDSLTVGRAIAEGKKLSPGTSGDKYL